MVDSYNVITGALVGVATQLVYLFPKLIVTLIIWWVGKYLIGLAAKLVRKIDIKGTKIDDNIVAVVSSVILVVGKILLVLVVLDYWNIGQPIISALANGLALTFAIALGLAFGKALEPEARSAVDKVKHRLEAGGHN